MKKFNGFKAERPASSNYEALPAGNYIGRIVGAKVEEYQWGSVLVVAFDIAEGEYKDYFDKQFKESNFENKKWKGTFRITVPQEGSQYFDNNLKTFNNSIWAIEDSNNGYTWDWHEEKLKGKLVGLSFGNVEWEYEGKTGWHTECRWFTSIKDINDGKAKTPKDKPLKNKTNSGTVSVQNADIEEIIDDEDIPF